MKKSLLTLLSSALTLIANATITVVTVTNFQFSPANPTVIVNDTIRFNFVAGFHNATSAGNTLPAGAAAINSGAASSVARTFDYKVTVAGSYSYYCAIHGGSGGVGMAANFTATTPTPLTFGLFKATIASEKKAILYWNTYNEVQVKDFTIRRSIDGLHFEDIAKVAANGGLQQEYTYDDTTIPNNRYIIYQLAIMDLNGSKTYSNTVTLKNTYESKKLITKLGPTPITKHEQLMIQFNADNSGWMDVDVYNMDGKKVMDTKMQAMPGLNNGHLHLCDLATGTYQIKFSFENKTEVEKVIVQ